MFVNMYFSNIILCVSFGILLWISSCGCDLFFGGTIGWKPSTNSSEITLEPWLAWQNLKYNCSNTSVAVDAKRDNFSCTTGCTLPTYSVDLYCTDAGHTWSSVRGRLGIAVINSQVTFRFTDDDWLLSAFRGASLVTRADLQVRNDTGVINTPPITTMLPLLSVIYNITTVLKIPESTNRPDSTNTPTTLTKTATSPEEPTSTNPTNTSEETGKAEMCESSKIEIIIGASIGGIVLLALTFTFGVYIGRRRPMTSTSQKCTKDVESHELTYEIPTPSAIITDDSSKEPYKHLISNQSKSRSYSTCRSCANRAHPDCKDVKMFYSQQNVASNGDLENKKVWNQGPMGNTSNTYDSLSDISRANKEADYESLSN